MDMLTAAVQRNLSYLVIGGTIILIFLSGIQWNGTPIFVVQESMANRLFDAAFLVVLLFWFQRQRAINSESIPPGSTATTKKEETTTIETKVEPVPEPQGDRN